MKFEVLILGCSSATPMHGRHPTAQLINIQDQLLLVDCGEGTQMRLSAMGVKVNRIKAIFISHLHGDHCLGLVGLLSSMHLMGRKNPLEVYGPVALQSIVELQFLHAQTTIQYPLTFHATMPEGEHLIREDEYSRVYSFQLDHRIPCTGFRVEEKSKSPAIRLELVESLGVPRDYYSLLKKKHDFVAEDGTVYPWQQLTSPPPAPRKYAFCSDTAASGGYIEAIKGVNLLYHEATFMHDMADRAEETFHSTALQAGQVAEAAGVGKLLIGHYSARYKDIQPLWDEARAAFPHTEPAMEGRWYPVTY